MDARATMDAIAFRPLARGDLPLLLEWLQRPHVADWWRGEPDTPAGVEARYGPQSGDDGLFVLEHDGVAVGFFQCYRLADEPAWDRVIAIPDAAGIDYLIGEAGRCGRGLGSAAIGRFATLVLARYPEVAVVVAAPLRDNRASCRALEKAGFALRDERWLDVPDDPSNFGVSAIYALSRAAGERSAR